MKKHLAGLNFYEVEIQKTLSLSSYYLRTCTYRSVDEISRIFKEQQARGQMVKFRITELTHDWILEDESYWFPVYCVELNNVYVNLAELIEDILVGKLSGILPADMSQVYNSIHDMGVNCE